MPLLTVMSRCTARYPISTRVSVWTPTSFSLYPATCSCPRRLSVSSMGKTPGSCVAGCWRRPPTDRQHPSADEILNQRWAEIFVIPDILCNSGGVIVSYFEWVQDLQNFFWSDIEVTDRLYRILETTFTAVIRRSKERKIPHRMSALSIGVERVIASRQARGLFP